jgi:hypothetical protein
LNLVISSIPIIALKIRRAVLERDWSYRVSHQNGA